MTSRPALTALALAACLVAPSAPALATDGNYYEYGPSGTWGYGFQAEAFPVSPLAWQISLGALNPAWAGTKFDMRWGCPVDGSQIAFVRWSALRNANYSSMEQRILVDGSRYWAAADRDMPQSPAGGRPYEIGLPATCSVNLQLEQTETTYQHARTYWIDNPRILVRDVWGPSVVVRHVTQGWINASQNAARVDWTTGDNFGADGIGRQQVMVGGLLKWQGWPGQGDFAVDVDLSGVGDGTQTVRVDADGDGTGGSGAEAWIYVDRTVPWAGQFGVGYGGAPGRADLAWTAGDNFSGVAGSALQVNAATDGSPTGGWVTVAQGGGGDGARSVSGAVTSLVADGVHAWRAHVTDQAGNVGVHPAPGTVVVDTTPPRVDLAPLPAGWVARLPIDLTLRDNLEATLGLGTTDVEVNAAADGGASGAWVPLAGGVRPPGRHTESHPLTALADGPHLVRVRTRNGGPFGGALVGQATGVVKVDLTSPRLSGVAFRSDGPDRVVVDWAAQDPLSGVATARVEWRDEGGAWRTLAAQAAGEGAGSAPVSLSGVPEGRVRLRLLVADAAGNTSTAESPEAGLAVDRHAPLVIGPVLEGGPPWRLRWAQEDPGSGLGICPGSIQVRGGATDDWREILAPTLGAGQHVVDLPVDGLPAGAYRVRVVVCDAVGNRASAETGGLVIPPRQEAAVPVTVVVPPASPAATGALEGLGSPGSPGADAVDPFAALRRSRLLITVPGARLERFGGRPFWVRSLRFGDRLPVRGRLLSAAGRGVRRAEIQVRGYKDRLLGRTTTDRRGRFALRVRPDAAGVLRVGVPAGDELLPARPSAGVRVRVRPVVTFRPSTRTALAFGAPVAFAGRLKPSPGLLGGDPKKGIILEWLDPIRKVWRPVLNARVRRDGTFRLAWRFQVRGITIPMRLRVPVERGWPLDGVKSPTVAIRVR